MNMQTVTSLIYSYCLFEQKQLFGNCRQQIIEKDQQLTELLGKHHDIPQTELLQIELLQTELDRNSCQRLSFDIIYWF